MKILITGGTGYIGSHVAVELIKAGYDTVIFDNLSNSDVSILGRVEQICGRCPDFVHADIRDESAMNGVFAEHKPDAVIHFAGLKAVGESVAMPLEYYDNNVNGTLVLLRAMRKNGCKCFVFSSSATVYGVDNQPPYTEDMCTSAINPYGWTKVMIEQILRDVCVTDPEMKVVALRYFNPIGAHPSGLIGEEPSGIPNNLFPYIARVASGELEKLSVTGADYPTADGTGERDYIHVVDLALGHLAALRYAAAHTGFEPVNLGAGRGVSVLELLRAFEKACGRELPHQVAPRRPGDLAVSYADTSRARALLDWRAERTIEECCADGWKYMINRKKD